MDKTHIDKIAQQVLQIANRDIKNAFDKNGGCVRDTRTEFTTDIDHVDIADIVYPGYTLWYDEDGIATIYMNSNVWFDGVNPSLPRDKIVAEVRRSISAEFEDAHITYAKNTYKGAWITGDGDIMLHCNADWMVDIKTPDSSNSVDDVALLIKNAIEHAIDGSEIGVKYKVLY